MGDGSLGALGQVGGPTGDSPQGPGFDSEKLVETCGHLFPGVSSRWIMFQLDVHMFPPGFIFQKHMWIKQNVFFFPGGFCIASAGLVFVFSTRFDGLTNKNWGACQTNTGIWIQIVK